MKLKFAVGAITDTLWQEVGLSIRTTVILPGAIATELTTTIKHEATFDAFSGFIDLAVSPQCIADAIAFAVGQPADVAVNEIVVRPAAQTF